MTPELPVALRPWAASLAMFPDDLALAIGDLVRRLALALGEFRVDTARGTGEPDGFDGITRRGELERLLNTEWLLASELPDEFLRRVASAEVSYLKIAQRDPAKPRWSVALLDAGPAQIGSPRVGQLAALITLAARAERAHAKFRWALLQRPVGTWVEGLSESSIKAMLAGRSEIPASSSIDAWLADPGAESGDLWVLGSDELISRSLPTRVSRLVFSERGIPGASSLLVTCKPAAKQARTVELPLPDSRTTVRVIRDPFEGKRIETKAPATRPSSLGATPRIVDGGNVVFVEGGRRLVYIGEQNTLVAQPIPNSPNANLGRRTTATLAPAYAPLACGWKQGRFFVAASSPTPGQGSHSPGIFEFGKRGGLVTCSPVCVQGARSSTMRWAPPPEPSVLLGRCFITPPFGQGWELIQLQDGAGRLVSVRAQQGSPPEFEVEGRAMAVRSVGAGVAYITRTEPWSGPDSPLVIVTATGASRVDCGLDRERIVSAYFGPNWTSDRGPLAVRYDGDEWSISTGTGRPTSIWVPGRFVHGLTLVREDGKAGPLTNDSEPALVVSEGARIEVVGRRFKRELFVAPQPVRSATVCDVTGNIGCVLESGDLYVFSPTWMQPLLYLRTNESSKPGASS